MAGDSRMTREASPVPPLSMIRPPAHALGRHQGENVLGIVQSAGRAVVECLVIYQKSALFCRICSGFRFAPSPARQNDKVYGGELRMMVLS